MDYRFTGAGHSLCAGRKAGALVVLRLWAVFFITLLMTTVLWPQTTHAVPVGTSISNTASTSYTVSGITGFTENSNTEQFLVADSGIPDAVTLTVTETSGLYFIGGDAVNITVAITNTGGNTQAGSEIRMSVPTGSTLILNGSPAAGQTNNGLTTVHTFNVANISVGNTVNFTALLTLPINVAVTNNIINTAYFTNGAVISNNVLTLSLRGRTMAKMRLMQYSLDNNIVPQVVNATEYDTGGAVYAALAAPNIPNTAVPVTSGSIRLAEVAEFSHQQIIFINVDDFDRNLNSLVQETIEIALSVDGGTDIERLILTEVGIDSGIFTGYITISQGSPLLNDGVLNVSVNNNVEVFYQDMSDPGDVERKAVVVDPYGKVFNSVTGGALNGYTVHIVDTHTGLPATVFGDDGISTYPATVVTGGTVTDGGGKFYNFDNGSYRFPLMPVGNYQLIVEPPSGASFRWPSTASNEVLATIANGPHVITLGSRGETFPLQAGPPLHIDIPLDPVTTPLYVRRTASQSSAAPGDFVQFKVEIENLSSSVMNSLILSDILPHGFRLEQASVRVNGVVFSAFTIAASGKLIDFNLGMMASTETVTVEYVTAVGAVNKGVLSSSSGAESNGGLASSNTAVVEIMITEELMRSAAVLMGRVVIDDGLSQSGQETEGADGNGLSGARIVMEDGRYAITDERGMYHFDDVTPGTHVLQLDIGGLPEQYEAVMKEDNTRFSGNAWSQFVDVQGGSLWRADFHVRTRGGTEGVASVQIKNTSQQQHGELGYEVSLSAEKVALANVRLTVVLPAGTSYKQGSSQLDGSTISDPTKMDGMLIYRLGDSASEWRGSLQYTITLPLQGTVVDLLTKASLVFNTPSKKNQHAPLATHLMSMTAGGTGQMSASVKQRVVTYGARPGREVTVIDADDEDDAIEYDWDWLSSSNASGEFEWLVPVENALPAIPSTTVSIKHDQFHRVTLSLNGEPVSEQNYDGAMRNRNGASMSIWSGVDLLVGDNIFEATVIDLSDQVLYVFKRLVHFSSPPVRAELVKEASILVADGVTNPVIAVRLYDRDGYPARDDVIGGFEINPNYKIQRDDDFEDLNMPGASLTRHQYRVVDGGMVKIKLEPTTESGDVELNFLLANNIIEAVNAPLRADVGEWLLVGLAEGSVGHNALRDNVEPLPGSARDDDFYSDGRIAFYGKGRVLGKWILTLAYDSDKKKRKGLDPELFQQIDPGKYYTLYGDTGHNGFDARSSEKLYLKLERDEFYFLLGDYETNLDNVELAQYSRTLTGIKSRYHTAGIDVVVFASESNQAFVRDEIRGEGRSGPYHLSRKNIAMNSEVVTIEVRDRFRSEIIVDRREMARHSEYDIDYREGTITFREAVYSTDFRLNPAFIVVKYESFDQGDDTLTMGGHVEVDVTDNTSVGVTKIDEGRIGGDAEMEGINVRHRLNDNMQLKVEMARSFDERESGSRFEGSAYTAEIASRNENLDTRAYVREQEGGFGLGQSSGSENGSSKAGVEASLTASERVRIKGQLYRQEALGTGATRTLVEAEGSYQFDSASARIGARTVRDERGNGIEEVSDQITAGATKYLFDNRLVARIDREQNISSNKINSSDFPNRTRLGADYRLTDSTDLFVEQEFTDGDLRNTRNTLLGVKSSPWEGGRIYTGLKKSSDDERATTSANVALQQQWLLTESWSLDVGVEESQTVSDKPTTPLNANVPFASGNRDDFSAASLGLSYAPGDWLWTGRLEMRAGRIDDTWGIASSLQTTPNQALSTLFSLQYSERKRLIGESNNSTGLRLGMAYRPENSRWILLDKLDLKLDESTGGAFNSKSWRVINNFNANYKANEKWQHSLQYGMKTINEVINNRNYKAFVDLMGIESRYNINAKWDTGVHANVLHHWDLKQYDYNTGLSVGHTLAKNIWVSVGYNFVGFKDKDFSAARYTSKGIYVKFRMKFDQTSIRDAVKWAVQ